MTKIVHEQILNGASQTNITMGFLLQMPIPFSMIPGEGPHRWRLHVPIEFKDLIQRVALAAGEVVAEEPTEEQDGKSPGG